MRGSLRCERTVLPLLLGGYDTTGWMIASVLAALLAHPEAMARVRSDPALGYSAR